MISGNGINVEKIPVKKELKQIKLKPFSIKAAQK